MIENTGIIETVVAFGLKWAFYLAGIFGAALGSVFAKVEPLQKIFQFAGGVGVSWICGKWIGDFLHMPEAVAGLVVGIFGMAIFSKIYTAIQDVPFVSLVNSVLESWANKWRAK